MYKSDGKVSQLRGIDRHPSRDEARSLDEIHSLLERLNETWYRLRIILVVTVDTNNSFIPLIERKGVGAYMRKSACACCLSHCRRMACGHAAPSLRAILVVAQALPT